jgi:hypothetical protein
VNDPFKTLANASGFLFQIGVEYEIKKISRSYQEDKWEVIAREHRWVDPVSNSEAFIDLILQYQAARIIVECKRTTDATWLFLIPIENKMEFRGVKLLWTYQKTKYPSFCEWDDFTISPTSPESSFCVIRGKGEGNAPMLERLAGVLLRSTEAVAEQELSIGSSTEDGTHCIYLPVIVTNAELRVCHFSPGEVELTSGKLKDVQTEKVSLVMFRKGLSTTHRLRPGIVNLKQLNTENERTVLIMNVDDLGNILSNILKKPPSILIGNDWPWDKALRRFERSSQS